MEELDILKQLTDPVYRQGSNPIEPFNTLLVILSDFVITKQVIKLCQN